jgi:hypothetical protein
MGSAETADSSLGDAQVRTLDSYELATIRLDNDDFLDTGC